MFYLRPTQIRPTLCAIGLTRLLTLGLNLCPKQNQSGVSFNFVYYSIFCLCMHEHCGETLIIMALIIYKYIHVERYFVQ